MQLCGMGGGGGRRCLLSLTRVLQAGICSLAAECSGACSVKQSSRLQSPGEAVACFCLCRAESTCSREWRRGGGGCPKDCGLDITLWCSLNVRGPEKGPRTQKDGGC